MVASAVNTTTSVAAFTTQSQRHRYRKWPSGATSAPDDITKQLAEAVDYWEAAIEHLQSRLATDGTLQVNALAVTGATTFLSTAAFVGNISVNATQRVVSTFVDTITFSELGSGASDTIAITGFPTNALVCGASAVATTQFTGEPDLAFTLGDTAAAAELVASTALHETGDDVPIAVVRGTYVSFTHEADYSTAGLAVTFTATELDDVSAGVLQVRIHYITA